MEVLSSCPFHISENTNIARNFVKIFYNFWCNKISIAPSDNDKINNLEEIWYFLVEKTLETGLTFLVLDYGTSLTITTTESVVKNKNGIPIGGKVVVKDETGINDTIYVLDSTIFKDEIYKNELLKKLGWVNEYQPIKIYKAIPFQLNTEQTPMLADLKEILRKICCLSYVDDKNLEVANVIVRAYSDQKLTTSQAGNISATISCDKRTVVLVNQIEDVALNNISSELVSSISNWPNISSELSFYIIKFYELSGITFHPTSAARQNTLDSANRIAISNSIENIFYNWVSRFIRKFESFYKVKVEYTTNSAIELIRTLSNVNSSKALSEQTGVTGEENISEQIQTSSN